MIKSMTGYGRGEQMHKNRRVKIEIKGVNHRFLELNIRLPKFLNPFSDSIRKLVSQEIKRGKVDIYINCESLSCDDIAININEAYADAYMAALDKMAKRYNLDAMGTLSLLAGNAEVFLADKENYTDLALEDIMHTLNTALAAALGDFNGMRASEGASILSDINEKLAFIQGSVNEIIKRAPQIKEEYAARIRERIEEALQGTGFAPDEGRILTEVAIFADRSCIDEEIVRMDSHIVQFKDILASTEPAGRKIDFLLQEMNREINTIGSKSNDGSLTKLVLDVKSELEKIREQANNIE